VVHYFKPGDQGDRALHGKRITYDRLGFTIYPENMPNHRMLLWHYKQCVQMHFRGFSYRISAQDTIADMQEAMAAQASSSHPVDTALAPDQQESSVVSTKLQQIGF
jgi:hypothetical protein